LLSDRHRVRRAADLGCMHSLAQGRLPRAWGLGRRLSGRRLRGFGSVDAYARDRQGPGLRPRHPHGAPGTDEFRARAGGRARAGDAAERGPLQPALGSRTRPNGGRDTMSGHRILTIAHGHPARIRGGGEIAAYNLHRAYGTRADVDAAWFLASAGSNETPSGRIHLLSPNEYIWDQSICDPFLMSSMNWAELGGHFSEALRVLRPTIVHVHHYFKLGLEILATIRRACPDATILMTLHDYMAICPNSGLIRGMDGSTCGDRYADHRACA